MFNRFKLLFALFILCTSVHAQQGNEAPCKGDSVCIKDSLQFYRTLHDFAARRKITSWMYGAVFRDPPPPASSKPMVKVQVVVSSAYKPYQGKVIRRIHIITVDPLGKAVDDTLILPGGFVQRAGNAIHIKTKNHTIRNKLLFKKGDILDSLKLIESERIIRQSTGIRDAKISPICPAIDGDSIDILIAVRDLWSISGDGMVSMNTNSLHFGDNNFLGLSHTIQNRVSYDVTIPNSFIATGNYQVTNIENTFISGNAYYTYSEWNKTVGLSFDRGFISTITKWAGGFNNAVVNTVWPISIGTELINSPLNYHLHDAWLGRSFHLTKTKINRYNDPRVIITGRVSDLQYTQRPSFRYDSLRKNQNTLLYMGSIGFCTRSYYKDINIYRFGRVEDVPEGRLLALVGGYQIAEFDEQAYYGLRFAAGNHFNHFGYLGEKAEYGTFLRNGLSHQAVINLELNFLTDLLQYRKWSAREFINFKSTFGMRRDAGEHITLNDPYGIYGFNSPLLQGTDKTCVNMSTVIYMPYKFIGFQFAAILFAGFGKLVNVTQQLLSPPVYQAYGIGVLLRNENLVINTIQISLNYYPLVPGKHPDFFQFNPSTLSDLKFTDFYLSKPDYIGYQ
jgi:hypothetical protein